MRWLEAIVFSMSAVLASAAAAMAPLDPERVVAETNTFTVLAYHEVRDDVRDYPDPYATDAAALVGQFSWLSGNGYVPVSIEEILTARRGGKPLPAKAVLLSFDDGYLSFYARVFPLLREFRFPAVLAVVGDWIDNPAAFGTAYGEKSSVPEAGFPTWTQLREMAASGWVEIASHTYGLHQGILANPQGNLQPAATARIYDAASGTHESDAAWHERVRSDLAHNADVIERGTGHRPRAIAWPYGSYNNELVSMAKEMGMPVAITLDDGANTPDVALNRMRRTLVEHDPALAGFVSELRGPLFPEPVRVVQLSLDAVYNADPALQEANLSLLLERIKTLKPTHVYLQATADTDGDGIADAAYFPTRHLPLRADLFNRVAWQLAARDDVKVFAVLPVAGYRLPQDQITGLYEDIARYANFDGLLFMQDVPAADKGMTGFVQATQALAGAARRWRGLSIARGFTAGSTAPRGPALARTIAALAAASDYVVVAIPAGRPGVLDPGLLPPAEQSGQFSQRKPVPSKLIVMLRRQDGPIVSSGKDMAQEMRRFQLQGVLNFGYSGDDFSRDEPPIARIAPAMSLRVDPR